MDKIERPDMPTGLIMALAQDLEAMQTFSNLSPQDQRNVVSYIQASKTGDDVKVRIETVVDKLHNHISIF